MSSFHPPSSGGSIPPGTRRSRSSPRASSPPASLADGACRPSACVLSARCACNNTRSPSTTAAPFGSCVSSGGGDGGCRTCRTSREERRSSTRSDSSSDLVVGVSGSVYVRVLAAGVRSSVARMTAFVTARAYVVSYASVVTMTESAMMRRSSRRSCVRDGVNPVGTTGEFGKGCADGS